MTRERGGIAPAVKTASQQRKKKRKTQVVRAVRKPREKHHRPPLRQSSRELIAKVHIPKPKYQSYLEFVDNKDKKKKLDFQITHDKNPPPGFTFVPIGNPDLTRECKELSREQGYLIFIVTGIKELQENLGANVHRRGYHFRSVVVEQAALATGGIQNEGSGEDDKPEPIPETQEDINKQAYDAIRDLYPRMPFVDMETIVGHAFKKGGRFGRKAVVGMQAELTLSRRVQLAVLAHIRHQHTRYDKLLRETDWASARKAVEQLCLETLLKWRGDEETGRDQLDEIVREVVIIPDSDDENNGQDDSLDEEATAESSETDSEDVNDADYEDEEEDTESDEVIEIMDQVTKRVLSRTSVASTGSATMPHEASRPPSVGAASKHRREPKIVEAPTKRARIHGTFRPDDQPSIRIPLPSGFERVPTRVVEYPLPPGPDRAHPSVVSRPRDPRPTYITESPPVRRSPIPVQRQDIVLPSIETAVEPVRVASYESRPMHSPTTHHVQSDRNITLPGSSIARNPHEFAHDHRQPQRVVLVHNHERPAPPTSERYTRLPSKPSTATVFQFRGQQPVQADARPATRIYPESISRDTQSLYRPTLDSYDDSIITERVATLGLRDTGARDFITLREQTNRPSRPLPSQETQSIYMDRHVKPYHREVVYPGGLQRPIEASRPVYSGSYQPRTNTGNSGTDSSQQGHRYVNTRAEPRFFDSQFIREPHNQTQPFITIREPIRERSRPAGGISQQPPVGKVPLTSDNRGPLRRYEPNAQLSVNPQQQGPSGPIFVRRISSDRDIIVLD